MDQNYSLRTCQPVPRCQSATHAGRANTSPDRGLPLVDAGQVLRSLLRRRIGQPDGQGSTEDHIWRPFTLFKWWPGARPNRRPSDFQFQVHLIGVGLPGILLAVVTSSRHQKYLENWSYWTVHWTPLGGMSDDRRAASACGATCSRHPTLSISSRLGEQLVEIAVEPEQCLIRDRRSQAAGATETSMEITWVSRSNSLGSPSRANSIASIHSRWASSRVAVPPPLICRAGTR
jgi:hypothetical protein